MAALVRRLILSRAGFPGDEFISNADRLSDTLDLQGTHSVAPPSALRCPDRDQQHNGGADVESEQHEFVRTLESRWYYWWAARVSIPAPED
jgi:hypothetical protein